MSRLWSKNGAGSPRSFDRGDLSRTRTADSAITARGITVQFLGLKALDEVDLTLSRGEILGLIGPNGAGKTTLINVLSGFQPATSGQVFLDGQDITRLPANRRGQVGISRSFQHVRPFADFTVEQNVLVAGLAGGLGFRAARAQAAELITEFGLQDRAEVSASALATGEERLLGVVRALATNPSYLLLDEPAAGLNEEETMELLGTLRRVHEKTGAGIMVVEHDVPFVMSLCDRVQVLDFGKTIACGTPAEIAASEAVNNAYLGGETAADESDAEEA